MKKNISINISGIIFHIEETAYEKLHDYLEGINTYFSSFDGSEEIIADIESRIAELFLARLTDNKQVINVEDVDSLITTMGSIKDFQAMEDQESAEDSQASSGGSQSQKGQEWSRTGSKRMYRDEKRKLLGGVCAGFAHYFNIDPLWVRLITVLLILGSYGWLLLAYIILWVVLPANTDLPEDQKLKKMYRNPDGKVIAGVSSGIAAYFAVDVAVVRLLFVIFTFVGGTGLLVYIILWIILPEAKSVTDRVQMEGEPITLSNIESNIKKSLNVKEGEENLLVKILLFPFRLIATILTGLGNALGPLLLFLVDFLRILAGAVFILTGIALVFSIVVASGMLIGVITTDMLFIEQHPFMMLNFARENFPVITAVAGFFLILIPSVFAILLGISIIAKKIIFNATAGWSLFAIFFASIIVVSVNVPQIVHKFRAEGVHEVTHTYDLAANTAVLKLRETGMEDYEATTLKLRGHEGPQFELIQNYKARGSSRANAIENAKMISYNVAVNDSILTFDSNVTFNDTATFRNQRLEMTLYIPYDQPFKMDEDLKHIIRNTIHRNGYRVSDMEGNTWTFISEDQLKCLTCPELTEEKRSTSGIDQAGKYDKEYTFREFDAVEITNAFIVNLVHAEEFKVGIDAKKEYLDDIEVYVKGNRLYIDYDKQWTFDSGGASRDDMELTIFTPQVSDIDLSGACKLYMNDFEQRNMSISLRGASHGKISRLYVDDLELDLSGASEMELHGRGQHIAVELSGASQLNAVKYEARDGKVEANGASSAKVYVTNELRLKKNVASDVDYEGNPRVIE